MILDWTISEPVAVESPVWIWPYGVWEEGPAGPVRWVILFGHLLHSIMPAQFIAGEAPVQHSFTIAAQVANHATVPFALTTHTFVCGPTGHVLLTPHVEGHEFLPAE